MRLLILALGLMIAPLNAQAEQCEPWLDHYEQHYSIPSQLLHAIGRTESGRYSIAQQQWSIWPWTVHTEGKGYYFDTKEDATIFIQATLASGVTNIDIGCMQVNWRYHGHAFSSIEEMLSPERNIAYATHYLKAQLGKQGHWPSAVGAYHSFTEEHASRYQKRVMEHWHKMVGHTESPERALLIATLNPKHMRVRQRVESDVWQRSYEIVPEPQPETAEAETEQAAPPVEAEQPAEQVDADSAEPEKPYAVATISNRRAMHTQPTLWHHRPKQGGIRMIFE